MPFFWLGAFAMHVTMRIISDPFVRPAVADAHVGVEIRRRVEIFAVRFSFNIISVFSLGRHHPAVRCHFIIVGARSALRKMFIYTKKKMVFVFISIYHVHLQSSLCRSLFKFETHVGKFATHTTIKHCSRSKRQNGKQPQPEQRHIQL